MNKNTAVLANTAFGGVAIALLADAYAVSCTSPEGKVHTAHFPVAHATAKRTAWAQAHKWASALLAREAGEVAVELANAAAFEKFDRQREIVADAAYRQHVAALAKGDAACPRCGGSGVIALFGHVESGRCFRCTQAPVAAPRGPVAPCATKDCVLGAGHDVDGPEGLGTIHQSQQTPCEGVGCDEPALVAGTPLCEGHLRAAIDELSIAQREHAAFRECIEFEGDECGACADYEAQIASLLDLVS